MARRSGTADEYEVKITTARCDTEYRIWADSHVEAAREGLETFAAHGHAGRPYHSGDLEVNVEEIRGTG